MIKWKKILIDRSNKITKINKIKNFDDFSGEVEAGGYHPNENYENKSKFFNFYLKGKYIIWNDYLKNNLDPKAKTLSLASGRGINELSLISNNFNVVCSDLEIPKCYEVSKKIFENFDYIKLNILEDKIDNKFDNIYCISALYIFSNPELDKIFKNISNIIKKDGAFIVDFGGTEVNITSFLFHEFFLVLESYFFYFLSKFINKKVGFKFDHNFGYRRKNREIIEFLNKFGFELVEIKEYDYLTEPQRSILIRKTIEFIPISKKIFSLLGRNIPYIRFFKFKKTN